MTNPSSLCTIIGESRYTSFLRKELERVATDAGGVYLEGEVGVGKELSARMIHDHSARRQGPFRIVDCARFFPNDLTSILFGSEERPATSLLARTDGGTLYIVHPEEMVLEMQERLERFISEGEFTLGEGEVRRVADVRILVGTEKDLELYCKEGMLLKRIWDYIAANRLQILPLRERKEDIDSLIAYFTQGAVEKRIDSSVLPVLKRYAWPGNYDELIEEIERLMRTGYQKVSVEHIRRDIVEYDGEFYVSDPDILHVLQEIEQFIQTFQLEDKQQLDFAPYFWRGGPPVQGYNSHSYDLDNKPWEKDQNW